AAGPTGRRAAWKPRPADRMGSRRRPFEEFDHMSVGVAQVDTAAAAVDARIDLDRLAECGAAGGDEPLEPFIQIVARDTDMRKPDVGGTLKVSAAIRRDVFKQLDPGGVLLRAECEMGHADVRSRLAHNGLDIAAHLFLLEEQVHSQRVSPETQRSLQV